MKSLIEYPLVGGGSVLVEVDQPEAEGVVRAARPGEIAARASQTFEDALDSIRPAIASLMSKLKELSAPGQIGVEFGIKLGAKAGAVFTSADVEANFKVSLTWKSGD
jgi:NTP-dependent ternary system trypsin peptidase co-occuring protein